MSVTMKKETTCWTFGVGVGADPPEGLGPAGTNERGTEADLKFGHYTRRERGEEWGTRQIENEPREKHGSEDPPLQKQVPRVARDDKS